MATVRRAVFARIGWMPRYSGAENGAERPIGGGAYNKRALGGEICNFQPINGKLYGFFSSPKGADKVCTINLARVEPGFEGETLPEVTVIFVAPEPGNGVHGGGERIVGWYREAELFRKWRSDPTGQRWAAEPDGSRAPALCNVVASVNEAVLLPLDLRQHTIPRGLGGMGQANIRYTLDSRGEPDSAEWIKKALAYVDNYNGENLLTEPEPEAKLVCDPAVEADAGYASNVELRKAVEDHAMRVVEQEYQIQYEVVNVSRRESYDFHCVSKVDGSELLLEVKGTQTKGDVIVLTRNEVNLATECGKAIHLCVVHSIQVSREGGKLTGRGGKLVRYENWKPSEHILEASQFSCRLKPEMAENESD